MYHNRVKRKPDGRSVCYMITNRITQGMFILGNDEKAMMRHLLFEGEQRYGYRVWDYVIMDNHYHALIEVMDKSLMPEEKVIRLWRVNKKVGRFVTPCHDEIERFRDDLHDLSKLIGNFQQRFTQWYNKLHNKKGRLFEGRFDSVLVDKNGMLSKLMGYITMNPVRAGMVEEPSHYAWCGYTERIRNGKLRTEDRELVTMLKWEMAMGVNADEGTEEEVLARLWESFRRYLLGHRVKKRSEELGYLRDLLNKENLPLDIPWHERMQLKVRFATKGVALGSKQFIEDVAKEFRTQLGVKEREPLAARSWDGSYSIINHRKWVD